MYSVLVCLLEGNTYENGTLVPQKTRGRRAGGKPRGYVSWCNYRYRGFTTSTSVGVKLPVEVSSWTGYAARTDLQLRVTWPSTSWILGCKVSFSYVSPWNKQSNYTQYRLRVKNSVNVTHRIVTNDDEKCIFDTSSEVVRLALCFSLRHCF